MCGLSRGVPQRRNIHVHADIPFITIRPRIKSRNSQSISPAPLEIRDSVFQELIRISLASNYMEELVAGPGGLLYEDCLRTTQSVTERCLEQNSSAPPLRNLEGLSVTTSPRTPNLML